MNLFINCCPREESRTRRLADALLRKLGDYKEIDLYREDLRPMTAERVKKRSALANSGDFSDPMFDRAKEFAAADRIVIAAPYWDLSFPSMLKIYFENVYTVGLVSAYDENGVPYGLCRGSKLYYVTTAGGPLDDRFGYGWVHELVTKYFGIRETALLKAEGLDAFGADVEAILQKAIDGADL